MNLYEKMQKDMIEAMKSKDKDRLSVLRMVKGAMQLEHINNKKEMDEALVIDCVSKQIKLREDSITEFKKGGRQDLIDNVMKEISILKEYMPEQLSKEEVEKVIEEVFAKVKPTSSKDMGAVMREVTPLLKGKADMKMVSEIIKNKLN